jgi:hypothetical protein
MNIENARAIVYDLLNYPHALTVAQRKAIATLSTAAVHCKVAGLISDDGEVVKIQNTQAEVTFNLSQAEAVTIVSKEHGGQGRQPIKVGGHAMHRSVLLILDDSKLAEPGQAGQEPNP